MSRSADVLLRGFVTRSHSLPILDSAQGPSTAQTLRQKVWRTAITVLLCAIGGAAWRLLGRNPWMAEHLPRPANATLIALAVLMLIALVPAVHQAVFAVIEGLRCPSDAARRFTMLLIILCSGTYLVFTRLPSTACDGPAMAR